MKKLLTLVFVGTLVFGASSCQKCVECDNCPFGISGDACREDFDSNEDYEAAVANARAAGCDCTERLQ